MPAGALRDSLTFERRAPATDGFGNVAVGAWTAIAGASAIPAQLRPLRQSEMVSAQGVQGRALYEVTVRWTAILAGVRVTDRIRDARSGATYNVLAPPVCMDQRGRYLKFLAEWGGADG